VAKNASYDKNKDYYQILGISNTATTGDVLRAFNAKMEQLNADLKKKKITGEEYQAKRTYYLKLLTFYQMLK
jgi:DnaJ-class molecular chaperone